MGNTIMGIIMLLLVSVLFWLLIISPENICEDYSTKVEVAKPDEIENAISNVVSDLEKRDFVPVTLGVKWCPASKTYRVYASGIDRTKLGKYEP